MSDIKTKMSASYLAFFMLSMALGFFVFIGGVNAQVPNLDEYGPEAKSSMESVCYSDKVNKGPAAYANCLGLQIDVYKRASKIPNLDDYGSEAKSSMESVCYSDKVNKGPAAYANCLNSKIDNYKRASKIPNLDEYGPEAKSSMESVCYSDKVNKGPAEYAVCLNSQVRSYANAVKTTVRDVTINSAKATSIINKQNNKSEASIENQLLAEDANRSALEKSRRADAERDKLEIEQQRQRLAEEKRRLDAEKTVRDQEARQIAEEKRRLDSEKVQREEEARKIVDEKRRFDAEKAQREEEKKSSRIAIKGSATQPDANGDFTITIQTGADTASLKIDGDELGGKRDGNYVIKRVARVGEENSYKITARDVFGNTDSATVTVARQVADSRPAIPRLNPSNVRVQQSRDAVAIIIGIENYRRVAKADFANADAKDFYTYASRALGIKPENIKLLVDDGADDIEMLNAFQNWLPLKVNKGKTDVYVFYSGHGYPSQDGKSLYFLPFNVDKQYLDRTSVKQKEMVAALQRAQAKSVTMFIDACYSGQTRNGEVLVAGIKPVSITTEERAYPPEFTVITASAADQFSSASQDLKHGIFSFYLMKALEGDADENKDGRITSGELQRYLSDMVGRQAMGLNRTQNTQLFGDADRVLVGR